MRIVIRMVEIVIRIVRIGTRDVRIDGIPTKIEIPENCPKISIFREY